MRILRSLLKLLKFLIKFVFGSSLPSSTPPDIHKPRASDYCTRYTPLTAPFTSKETRGLMYKDLRGFPTETWRTLKPKCPPTYKNVDVSMCAHAWIQAHFVCTSQSTWNWAHMSEYPTPPCPRPYLNMQIIFKWALHLRFLSLHDQKIKKKEWVKRKKE